MKQFSRFTRTMPASLRRNSRVWFRKKSHCELHWGHELQAQAVDQHKETHAPVRQGRYPAGGVYCGVEGGCLIFLVVTTGPDPVVHAESPNNLRCRMDCRIMSGNDEGK